MLRRFIANTTARIRAEVEASSFSLLTHAQFALALGSLVAAGSTVYAVRHLPAKEVETASLIEYYRSSVRCSKYCAVSADMIATFTVMSVAAAPILLEAYIWPLVGAYGCAVCGLYAGVYCVAREILRSAASAND